MSKQLLVDYTVFEVSPQSINESLTQIGFNEAFEVDKELLGDTVWFEEELLGNNATDFFHSRPVEYSKNSQTFDADDLF